MTLLELWTKDSNCIPLTNEEVIELRTKLSELQEFIHNVNLCRARFESDIARLDNYIEARKLKS